MKFLKFLKYMSFVMIFLAAISAGLAIGQARYGFAFFQVLMVALNYYNYKSFSIMIEQRQEA